VCVYRSLNVLQAHLHQQRIQLTNACAQSEDIVTHMLLHTMGLAHRTGDNITMNYTLDDLALINNAYCVRRNDNCNLCIHQTLTQFGIVAKATIVRSTTTSVPIVEQQQPRVPSFDWSGRRAWNFSGLSNEEPPVWVRRVK
jgi:hypothetical protein